MADCKSHQNQVWKGVIPVGSEDQGSGYYQAEVLGKAQISQVVLDANLHPHDLHSHYHLEECYTHPVHVEVFTLEQ